MSNPYHVSQSANRVPLFVAERLGATTDFPYDEIDDPPEPTERDVQLEVLGPTITWWRDNVLFCRTGRLRNPSSIGIRSVALYCLLMNPDKSLAEYGRALGVTRAAIARVSKELSDSTGLHAAWQLPAGQRAGCSVARILSLAGFKPKTEPKKRKSGGLPS